MSAEVHGEGDLLVSSNFVRAVRESGYVSLATALAELIDNSLQANATEVGILISRHERAFPRISVEDNGIGMDVAELSSCLRFGGTTRFDGRSSFGRFGMGLPAASLSQTRHVEVIAWQRGASEHAVTLDVDAITAGVPPDLSVREGSRASSNSGCRVVWRDCDRIEYQRLAWLERALRADLGRTYRRFIAQGLALTINGRLVEAIDPTLVATAVNGHSAELAYDPLTYELPALNGKTSLVTVRFTMLPVHEWHALDNVTKRRVGIVGQGGVSILRAGREISYGWHLMGSKRKENYDDWWRCEIEFEPLLDEHFGITINKQGIRPSRVLREALEPELESIARLLNGRVRKAFEDVKFQSATAASCRIAAAAETELPSLKRRHIDGPLSYRIVTAALGGNKMFSAHLKEQMLEITLNVDHPAFAALYGPLQTMTEIAGVELRTAIELLILAHTRTSYQLGLDESDMLQMWGETYGRMLQRS